MIKTIKILVLLLLSQNLLNPSHSIAATEATTIDSCKLAKVVKEPLSAGFPREASLMPSTGKVRNLFLFVDFPDNPSKSSNNKKFADNYFETTKKFLEDQSYGKMKPDLSVSKKFYRIKKNSASYKMFTDGQGDASGLVQDALDAADNDIDFSNFDLITVIPPVNTKNIKTSGAITGGGSIFKTKEKNFPSAIFIGKSKLSDFTKPGFGWSFYAHELGHTLGITHPFKYIEGEPGPIWDLMGNGGTSVPEFIGWHRFILNWLGEKEVVCIAKASRGSFKQTLKPLNSKEVGKKLLITPLSATQALVVEVRRQSTFDKLTPNETGVLVYLVDVTKGDDQGIITIITSKNTKKDTQILGSLKPGDKVSYKGITIQVVSSNKSGDTIKVSS
jgi:M6 family metalloprotease-like protein